MQLISSSSFWVLSQWQFDENSEKRLFSLWAQYFFTGLINNHWIVVLLDDSFSAIAAARFGRFLSSSSFIVSVAHTYQRNLSKDQAHVLTWQEKISNHSLFLSLPWLKNLVVITLSKRVHLECALQASQYFLPICEPRKALASLSRSAPRLQLHSLKNSHCNVPFFVKLLYSHRIRCKGSTDELT